MRFHIASDLHAELSGAWRALKHELNTSEDLILAGDVGCIENGTWATVVSTLAPQVRHLYVVLGNHDVWTKQGTPVDVLVQGARRVAARLRNVTLLHRSAARTPEGVDIAGFPLWSNPARDPTRVWDIITQGQDFQRIYSQRGKRLDVCTLGQWHKDDVAWFEQWMADREGSAQPLRPLVVVSHFAPREACNPPHYAADDTFLRYFCNELPDSCFAGVSAWVYGHVHGGHDERMVGSCRLLRHCVGYHGEADGQDSIVAVTVTT